jgi:uncharacterized protein (TIGR02421 family)
MNKDQNKKLSPATQKYADTILEYSLKINKCQKPILILDSIKWKEETLKFFQDTNFKEIPLIDKNYYDSRPINLNLDEKISEIKNIEKGLHSDFSEHDPVGLILKRNCQQYHFVIELLKSRGTKKFYEISKLLYGSTKDHFDDGLTKISDLGKLMNQILAPIPKIHLGPEKLKIISAEEAVNELSNRLKPFFTEQNINVKISDGLISDASAGSDYIKIKKGALFSSTEIDILEIHEGKVHLCTTINGQLQPYAQWLSKGPPCTSAIQEGLSVLMEIFNFVSSPERAKKINNRILACEMAEDGANVLDIIEFYRLNGYSESECLSLTHRTFRGGTLTGGAPFTKDISYSKGLVMIYNFLRSTIRLGRPEFIPFLFAGKITLDDIPVLLNLAEQGILERPAHIPHPFNDLNGLSVWMALSNFLNTMGLQKIHDHNRNRLKIAA